MLIKTKLYATGGGLFVVLIAISILAKFSFGGLSERLDQVVQGATDSAASAEITSQGSEEGSQKLSEMNSDMLAIVDGINRANQRTKLVSKKVDDISQTLEELIETIEELSEDVADEEALEILEEVSDEVSDISERLKREALININDTSKTLNSFSAQIEGQATKVSELNTFLREQVAVSQSSLESSLQIQSLAHDSSETVAWEEKVIVSVLVILALITLLSSVVMVKAIVHPINMTVKLMEDIGQGEGDLTQRLEIHSKDEMSLIAGAFNRFVSRIQGLIKEITESTDQLQHASGETLQAMQEGEEAMQKQQKETEQIATAISQMNMSSMDVAQNADGAENASLEVNQYADSGKTVVGSAVSSVSHLVEEVDNAVSVISELNEKSSSINSVVDVIQSVSEQTNLLALNAAIEAARAGEYGRGFAVVADEVRALAAKAEGSTADIRAIIEEMQSLINKAVTVMQSSQAVGNETLQGAQEAKEALESITSSMHTVTDMNSQIARVAGEQKEVTEGLNQRILQVNELSNHTSVQVSSTLNTCQSLNRISEDLSRQLSQFKI
ncbi:methyl-accepting chemotaxis protein [Vibrio sp. JC009]|uniref:methyl-accepting chemotaxis protein n=1 Tax=Vibrio sp. JC009 TaxID=2912314 RepID=UPI0023B1A1A6|nr:methyl-accepting chemotaxis protein [Vibrio sp. JC009]WED23873.1 methyl-accepting chemotaxis protein [Vibrio sp. JC009]